MVTHVQKRMESMRYSIGDPGMVDGQKVFGKLLLNHPIGVHSRRSKYALYAS